jgi:predicted  nucleic acid-binding Zn-ribbon protein
MSLYQRAIEEKELACKVAAKERIKAGGWKAKYKRAHHLRSQASTSLAGVESARDAALERELDLQQEQSAAAYRESTLRSELAVLRGELEIRANTITGLLRDLQDVTHARAATEQRLHEMEANYAALREEFYRVYYTLYPYMPPATPDEAAAPAADAPAGAAPGAATGSPADTPGDDDDGGSA